MLKNRQEGLTTLHGAWTSLAVTGTFYLYWKAIKATGLINIGDTNFNLQLLGILLGTLVSLRAYSRWAQQLSNLTWKEAFNLTKHQMIRILMVSMLVIFMFKETGTSRLFMGIFLVGTTFILLVHNRYLPRILCHIIFKENTIPTLFIGNLNAILRLNLWLDRKSNLGITPLGYITNEKVRASTKRIPYLGRLEDFDKIMETQQVGQIILLQNFVDRQTLNHIIGTSQQTGCRFHILNDLEADFKHSLVVNQEGEYTFYTLIDEPLENPINRMMKRSLDIAISLPIVAFVLPPLFFLVWLFQRKQAPGAVFYTQPRTGITKRSFNIIKFRTMYDLKQDDSARAVQASKDDRRIYPFGAFLRKTSLDEIPQFINVLLGDMSVAGPRPHLIAHDEEFSNLLRTYYTRHYVKPGITGLAQTKGYRGEISEFQLLEKRIHFDLEYINRWSLLLDIQIVFATIWQVFFPPKTAY